MGEVWKARDLELNQIVALKMIRSDLLEDPVMLDRFKQEITLARKVTHRNVTRIHDIGEVQGTRFISMEYLEGLTLKDYIKQEGPLPEEKAMPVMRAVCEALQAAHDAGIVHRDLKPQNILIDQHGQPHIMDFGVAFSSETAGLTRTGALVGTPEYMSPEQVRGEKLDTRSDIYSLGLILYEMVTADLPFAAESSVASMYKRLSEKPRKPRDVRKEVPSFLEKIILRCLEKERDFRYSRVGELLADLAEKEAPAFQTPRLTRLKPKALLLVVVVLICAVAAPLVYWALRGRLRTAGGPMGSVQTQAVAFLPFENATGSPALDWTRTGFSILVAGGLEEVQEIRVLGGERTQQTLDDLKLPLSGNYTTSDLKRAASVLGADILITGAVRRAGNRFQAETRLLRADNNVLRDLAAERVEGEGEESVFALADALAERIAQDLKVRLTRKRGSRQTTTGSVEALRLYSEGLELARRGRDLDASKQLEEAVKKDPSFALAQALLSQTYGRLGLRDRAVTASEQAMMNLDAVSDHEASLIRARSAILADHEEQGITGYRNVLKAYPGDADAHYELAGILEQKGDLGGASIELERCTSLDPKHYAALYALGRIRLKQGDSQAALKIFSDLLAAYTEAGNDEGMGTVYHALGNVRMDTSRYADALRYYRQALDIRTKIHDTRGMAVTLTSIASVLSVQGQYGDAIRAGQQALDLRTQMGDKKGIVFAWQNLGQIHEEAGHILEAEKCYQKSLTIVRDLDDPALLAQNVSSLGYVSSVLGKYAEAYLFYQEALTRRRELGNKREVLRSLIEIGLIEQLQGRYEKALSYAAESMGIAREIGEKAGEVVVATNLGMLHDDQGSYASALQSLAEAVEGARSIEDKSLLASSLIHLGASLAHVGDLQAAEERLSEAERLVKESGNATLLPELLNSQAEVSGGRGETERCLKALEEAKNQAMLLGDRRLLILTRLNLGRWSLAAGRPAGRSHLIWASEEAGKATLLPLRVRAMAYLAGAEPDAGTSPTLAGVKSAEEVLQEGKAIQLRESLVLASWVVARRALAKGDAAEARRQFQQAGDLVGEMSKGLNEAHRSLLLGRKDLAKLAQEASPYVTPPPAHPEKQAKAASLTSEIRKKP